jgi:hypothetical protein
MTDFLERYGQQLLISGHALSTGSLPARRVRVWHPRRPAALLLVGALIAAPVLAATRPWETTDRQIRKAVTSSERQLQKVRAGEAPAPSPPASVPAELAKVFPVLVRYPAAGSDSHIDQGLIADSTAPNVKLTRAVPSPPGAKEATWYLTPGADGLCLIDGEGGGGCGSLALQKVQGQFMIRAEKPPARNPDATVLEEIPLGLVSVLGIAPAGYATITVPNTDGTSRTVAVDDNGLYDFAIKPGDSFMTLDGPSMPPVRVRIP